MFFSTLSNDEGPCDAKNHKTIDIASIILPAPKTKAFVFSNTSRNTFLADGNL